jgi:hypothetical protein
MTAASTSGRASGLPAAGRATTPGVLRTELPAALLIGGRSVRLGRGTESEARPSSSGRRNGSRESHAAGPGRPFRLISGRAGKPGGALELEGRPVAAGWPTGSGASVAVAAGRTVGVVGGRGPGGHALDAPSVQRAQRERAEGP